MLGVLAHLSFRYFSYESEEETGIASTRLAIDLTALLLFGMVRLFFIYSCEIRKVSYDFLFLN